MYLWTSALHWHGAWARALDHLRSPLLLIARLWVGWQFLVSGWLKLTTWDTTIVLFENEYRTPLLPPLAAAVSYWHVLGSEGYEAALAQHVLWGFMLLVLLIFGVGTLSMDRLLERRAKRT